mgnify:CR=1 FL=1
MEIKILAPEEVEFKEKDIQNAFEKDLTKLEEALEFIASEVIVGAGRIDTLAFDTDNGNPVFIEYKKSGDFGSYALFASAEGKDPMVVVSGKIPADGKPWGDVRG